MNLKGDLRRLKPGAAPWGGRRWAAARSARATVMMDVAFPGLRRDGLPSIVLCCTVIVVIYKGLFLYVHYLCHMTDISTLSSLRIGNGSFLSGLKSHVFVFTNKLTL